MVPSVDRGDRPHYLTIYGGKLTNYRATAESVVQRVLPALPHQTDENIEQD